MNVVLVVVLAFYVALALGHFAYLYEAAKRIGYNRDGGRLTFIGVCSVFWPITWIVFAMDTLRRGRAT